MSSPKGIKQKKIILSTTEVSKMLQSKGRKKINQTSSSMNKKTNNIDLTELTSQINIKLFSKENDNPINITEQSLYKSVIDKSMFFKSNNKGFNQSMLINNFDKNPKENIISKFEQNLNYGDEYLGGRFGRRGQNMAPTEFLSEKYQIKTSYVINKYFPYASEDNTDMKQTEKLKNYLVIFYFMIDKEKFLLIRKLDKKFNPLYFWNREEDAIKIGITYSPLNTPGLRFESFDNFKQSFMERTKIKNKLKELELELSNKEKSYKNDINKLSEKYENKINEINNILKTKEDEINELTLDNNKLKERLKMFSADDNNNNSKIEDYLLQSEEEEEYEKINKINIIKDVKVHGINIKNTKKGNTYNDINQKNNLIGEKNDNKRKNNVDKGKKLEKNFFDSN